MTEAAEVDYSRRAPALTVWGKAALVGAVVLFAGTERTSPVFNTAVGVAAAVGVACAVDCAFALIGFRVRIGSIVCPTRASAGEQVEVRIRFDSCCDLLATIPGYHGVRPVGTDRRGVATITVPMLGRYQFEQFVLQVLRPGPLGLVLATQRAVLPLPEPLTVLPQPSQAVVPQAPDGDVDLATIGCSTRGQGPGGVQQLREHQPGDDFRAVHWAATARRGDLVVAVRDQPERGAVHLVIDVGDGGAEGDGVVARALTVVRGLLAQGDVVTITSWTVPAGRVDPGQWPYLLPRVRVVRSELATVTPSSMRDVEVALARTVAGPPSEVAGRAFLMAPEGDRWVDGPQT